jgi:hypothetical protein
VMVLEEVPRAAPTSAGAPGQESAAPSDVPIAARVAPSELEKTVLIKEQQEQPKSQTSEPPKAE